MKNIDESLFDACRFNECTNIMGLLQNGANIEAKDSVGLSPLMIASYNGHTECVRVLLGAGANIEAKANEGNTALIVAAFTCHKCVRTLIEAGANIEAKNDGGTTPLIAASVLGHYKCVETLLKAGANPFAKTNSGKTVYDFDTSPKIKEILRVAMNAYRMMPLFVSAY